MTAKVEVLKVRCPRCGARVSWAGNENRPFCSEKCRLIDLGRWADEEYSIAGQPVMPVDEEDSESY
ncbi:DNA gyrase inhibitor YacG [Desulfuromonas acetexigens]|jgi:endogenous inhibitor of DNA gyrase (YacG/DUF329 family)|uniref:DNA gyrase inhibitor YacG n=1 Tax=Trichloromonas acetexigens TaxID=38815 RepID=A0A550JL19_9BACT|nr:DNA gyrase inhibitor YacG [Desulfuromonas acetexigens]TRO83916.1 DNA gyrase inhibitor YacG [Desulfuromonas acetexigens]